LGHPCEAAPLGAQRPFGTRALEACWQSAEQAWPGSGACSCGRAARACCCFGDYPYWGSASCACEGASSYGAAFLDRGEYSPMSMAAFCFSAVATALKQGSPIQVMSHPQSTELSTAEHVRLSLVCSVLHRAQSGLLCAPPPPLCCALCSTEHRAQHQTESDRLGLILSTDPDRL
jgi:hypothetical protein